MFQAAGKVSRVLSGLALIGASHAMAAAPPEVNLFQEGTVFRVAGELSVPVKPSIAWAVLTDYERVPEYVPGMQVSKLVEKTGHVRVVEQQGEVMANNMRMLYQGTARFVEEPSNKLSVEFLSGPLRNMQGEWAVRGKKSPVKLTYQLVFNAGTPNPSPVMIGLLQQQVKHWVTSLATEMERVAATEPKPKSRKKPRRQARKRSR
ncbi:MAG: SRPBCC family protein [Thiobacillus sp.]